MSRVEQARTEIARRRERWDIAEQRGLIDPDEFRWLLAVLAAADATLDRHEHYEAEGTCDHCGRGREWPCPDAAAVLDLYAPAVKR